MLQSLQQVTDVTPPRVARNLRGREWAERIVRLDQRFALFTAVVPLAGTVAAVALALTGHPPRWIDLVLLAGFYTLVTGSQEVGWHRHFAHRAFEASRPVRMLFAAFGSMSFQGPLIWWVATHRRHHANADAPGDPHSPRASRSGLVAKLQALYQAHTGWTFDPERARPDGWARYAKELYLDTDLFAVHYRYFTWAFLGLALPALIGGLAAMNLEGAMLGLLWGGLVRVFLGDHFVRALNSVAHSFGRRALETKDLSRNNIWLVVPTFGQGWHQNHHAQPRAAIMTMTRGQIDPGGWIVRALERCGQAWNVRTMDKSMGKAPIAP